MAQALYQRYRPQQFSDVSGQDHIRTTLLSEIMHDDLAHAYMLSGPRGVGKTTTARLIARAINCTARTAEGEPCGTCSACVMILEQKALDVMEMDAASHTGVDHVRENIIEHARTAPTFLKKKVFIIDEVHMLSTSAFNALLKTLEEPPAHAVFILATTELHKVPATIISRCEHFRFTRLSAEHIVQRLRVMCETEGRTVDEAVLRHIARLADGAMRDAQSMLGQVLSIQAPVISLDSVAALLSISELQAAHAITQAIADQDLVRALAEVKKNVADGGQPIQVIVGMIALFRAALLARACNAVSYLEYEVADAQVAARLFSSFSSFSFERIARCTEHMLRAYEQQKSATVPELPLELACVHCCVDEQTNASIPQSKKSEQHAQTSAQVAAPAVATPPASVQKVEQKTETTSVTTPLATTPATVVEPVSVETPEKTPIIASVPVEPGVVEQKAAEPVTGEYTREHVEQRWPQVLEAMKKRNQGLYLTLQVGKLVDVKNKTIQLGFQYQFYQDRLYEGRNRKMIDEALTEVLGEGMHIEALIGKEFELKETTDAAGNVEVVSAKELSNVWDLAVHAFQPKHIEDVN